MKLSGVVRRAISDLDPSEVDKGTAELALTYARKIDDGEDLTKLGPQLLNVLEAMLMSPRSRAAIQKGMQSERATKSPLDELKAKRRARRDRAASVDPTAS